MTTPIPMATSRTITPLPSQSPVQVQTSDAKQKIVQLVRSKQYNQAFETVLSAADLKLVLYLCENIRASDLFSLQPCPLQIPVLLSLIQQLAADLTTHQEVKYRFDLIFSFLILSLFSSSYLYEALICLDLSHPSVRDYLQPVLADLNKKLLTYIQTYPTAPMAKRFQLLYMASQSLLQKVVQQRTTTPSTLK